jgi:hypothetical protein
MYCYAVNPEDYDAENNRTKETAANQEEFYYWRKFNNLHGWMQDLFYKKFPAATNIDFNCEYLPLTEEDLSKLLEDAGAGALPAREGFFWGAQNELDEEGKKNITSFVSQAREQLEAGKVVLYYSWW